MLAPRSWILAPLQGLRWLGLPGAMLIALLQRTPVLRLLTAEIAPLASSPVGQILRSAFGLAALGALHSRAGATTFLVRQGATEIINVSTTSSNPPVRNPATGAAGVALTPVAITYNGTPSAPQYFRVTGQLPPGLNFIPAPVGGTVASGTPAITGTPSQGGTFTVQVQGFGLDGNGQPEPIIFTISGASGTPPTFTLQPATQAANLGANVTFTAAASGSPAPTFQWRRNGANLTGATGASFTLPSVQPTDAGDYSVVATNSAGSLPSNVATLTVAVTGPELDPAARLTNLSVRAAMAANQTLIVGVAVQDGSRNLLVRAAGPALSAFELAGAMTDPRLELFNSAGSVLTNDDWPAALGPVFASVGAFVFPDGSKDAAFTRDIPTNHSIHARGNGPGIVLVEAYDTGAPATARLVNVSARNRAGTGDDVLIAGFTIVGNPNRAKRLLIRGVGPKLSVFGVTGLLADPILEIYRADATKVAENDNWDPSLAASFVAVGAFALDNGSRDAALIATLMPGGYTAQVRGATGGAGEALIEIYELP